MVGEIVVKVAVERKQGEWHYWKPWKLGGKKCTFLSFKGFFIFHEDMPLTFKIFNILEKKK